MKRGRSSSSSSISSSICRMTTMRAIPIRGWSKSISLTWKAMTGTSGSSSFLDRLEDTPHRGEAPFLPSGQRVPRMDLLRLKGRDEDPWLIAISGKENVWRHGLERRFPRYWLRNRPSSRREPMMRQDALNVLRQLKADRAHLPNTLYTKNTKW